MTVPIHTVDTFQRCWSTFHTFQMWSVQIIAGLPYFTSDQQENEAVIAGIACKTTKSTETVAWYAKCIENKTDSVEK